MEWPGASPSVATPVAGEWGSHRQEVPVTRLPGRRNPVDFKPKITEIKKYSVLPESASAERRGSIKAQGLLPCFTRRSGYSKSQDFAFTIVLAQSHWFPCPQVPRSAQTGRGAAQGTHPVAHRLAQPQSRTAGPAAPAAHAQQH